MLHHSEWLELAKRVPVGQHRRVRHGAEPTSAMDVYNSPDCYSAYCHRCHDWGKVRKKFVEPVTEPAMLRRYVDYKRLRTLEQVQSTEPKVYATIVKMLQAKGMSTVTVSDLNPKYSPMDKRLVFQFEGVGMGRDLTGSSPMKWFKYHHDNPKSYVYLRGKIHSEPERIVITEDLFSAQKVRYYTGLSSMALLGTRLTDEALYQLYDKRPVFAFDGDIGGVNGLREARPKLELLGTGFDVWNIPDGYDPKDLTSDHLLELSNG